MFDYIIYLLALVLLENRWMKGILECYEILYKCNFFHNASLCRLYTWWNMQQLVIRGSYGIKILISLNEVSLFVSLSARVKSHQYWQVVWDVVSWRNASRGEIITSGCIPREDDSQRNAALPLVFISSTKANSQRSTWQRRTIYKCPLVVFC